MTDDTKTLEDIFLNKKPAAILLAMAKTENAYPSQLAKDADCTFPHTLNTLKLLEEHRIVESEKEGRKKNVKLTSRGVDIAHDLAGLVRHLTEEDDKKEGEKPGEDEDQKEEE